MLEIKNGNETIRYPFIDTEEELSGYDPYICIREVDGKKLVDLFLNVASLDKEGLEKVNKALVVFSESVNNEINFGSFPTISGLVTNPFRKP